MIVNKDRIKIGNKIRSIREKQGYSSSRIAEAIGIRESSYNRIEEGKFSVGIRYSFKELQKFWEVGRYYFIKVQQLKLYKDLILLLLSNLCTLINILFSI